MKLEGNVELSPEACEAALKGENARICYRCGNLKTTVKNEESRFIQTTHHICYPCMGKIQTQRLAEKLIP